MIVVDVHQLNRIFGYYSSKVISAVILYDGKTFSIIAEGSGKLSGTPTVVCSSDRQLPGEEAVFLFGNV